MVLVSKNFDFIIKGAESLKQSHFRQVRNVQRQHLKRRLSLHITLLTIVNLFCVCYMLPTLTREHLEVVLGDRVVEQLFLVLSHVLALLRMLNTSSKFTLVLTLANEVVLSPKLHDTSTRNFHKIYSDDYLYDDDTISMLSIQFNCSSASTVRSTSIRGRPSPTH
ncbi:unnamed protein product [Ceratitis capitata]|uniref:(Mediterranean fruit fly) hypothetical protein n=1 Tax=Ceratitis capitata TaxID=7213 RepID=A0A811URE5_CERCA|nr:unnamed protein product [Ceratitis capitata]